MQPLFDLQLDIQKEIGKEKWHLEPKLPDEELSAQIKSTSLESLKSAFEIKQKSARNKKMLWGSGSSLWG